MSWNIFNMLSGIAERISHASYFPRGGLLISGGLTGGGGHGGGSGGGGGCRETSNWLR